MLRLRELANGAAIGWIRNSRRWPASRDACDRTISDGRAGPNKQAKLRGESYKRVGECAVDHCDSLDRPIEWPTCAQ